jgi:putative salt-induced outer membrane protein YdiY
MAICDRIRHQRDLRLVLIVLAPAWAQAAFGQAPAPPAEPPPPPLLEASAQLTFLDTRGNATSQSLGAGGDVVWRPDPWTFTAKAAFAQAESEGELTARSLTSLLRGSRALNDRLSAYGQYDFLRDEFAGIEQRHVLEGGISYLALDAAPHTLRLDTGLGYLYEERPDEELRSATLSLAAAYRLAISATSELTFEPRFLLPLAETERWKLDQEAALIVALNTTLALKLSHTLRYSAAPPEGFATTDTIMAVSLVGKLQRPR